MANFRIKPSWLSSLKLKSVFQEKTLSKVIDILLENEQFHVFVKIMVFVEMCG